MPRHIGLQILRGTSANIPVLGDGEFYFATDTAQLYVGLNSLNFRVGDPAVASVSVQGNANPTHFIEPNADGSIVAEGQGGIALAADGTDNTGIVQPGGGTGIRGWLSALYQTAFAGFSAKQVLATNIESVQQPKDCGRTSIVFNITEVASVATEALLSFNVMKGATQTTGQTSYTVSAGKTLRIQAVRFKSRFTTPSTTVTFAQALVNLRNAANVLAANILFGLRLDCASNVVGADAILPLPDGWEFPAGSIIAFSQLASATTLQIGGEVVGYEY